MSFLGTNFSYNGQDSAQFGVSLVQIDTGFLKRNFGVHKSINREKVRYKDVPLNYGSEKQTYPVPITIAKIDSNDRVWTYEERVKISKWLFPDDEFHEFISEDYPQLVFYFQFIEGESNTNPNEEGYITLTAEMNAPYPYSPILFDEEDLSDNTTSVILEYENMSNVVEYYYPTIEFTLSGNTTDFKIINHTVRGEQFIFTSLNKGETVCVDNLNKQIISDTGNERISNFNMQFLRLAYGINRLEIFGQCTFRIKSQFPMMV